MWVRYLGWEDSLKEEMVTHSSILAWEIPWTVVSGGLQSMGSQKSWTRLSDSTTTTWEVKMIVKSSDHAYNKKQILI